MRIELGLLGRFAASVQGRAPAVVPIAAPRLRAVLAYLAMQPAFAETRERLAALLWGDGTDKQARQSLRQCLFALRRELGPHADALVIERETVGLAPGRVAVDAREFLTLAEHPSGEAGARALALYRGEFLDGLDLDVAPFSEWLRAERAKISVAAARLFETCALAADKAGRSTEAIALSERLAAVDPGREHAQRLVLGLIARHRGREAALARAESVLAHIREQLDAEPENKTADLVASIRAMPDTPHEARPLEAVEEPALPPAPIFAAVPAAAAPHRRIGTVGRVAAAAAVLGGIALGAIAYDRSGPARGGEDLARAEHAPDPGWRSPLVPGAGPDQKALAAQGAHAVALDPQSAFAHASLAAALALQGDKAGAAAEAAKTRALAPWLTTDKMIERLVGLATAEGKPRRLLEGLRKAFDDPS